MLIWVLFGGRIMEQKIKGDVNINIGKNIHELRKARNIRQIDMVREMQLRGTPITRESLVKIEGGRQHIFASQLEVIRDILGVSYDDLLKRRE